MVDYLDGFIKVWHNGKRSLELTEASVCGNHYPVFVIDQASKLKDLLTDKYGQTTLERLFQWLVYATKEEPNFHAILISSDSFFDQWVAQFVGSSRYNTYVVGHLDREEAEIYWKEKLQMRNAHQLRNRDACPRFDNVFEVCGGSMYLMDKLFHEYCQESSNGLISRDVENFHVVLQEQSRMMAALALAGDVRFKGAELPKWTRDMLIELMTMLTTESTGYLDYDKACFKCGKEAIDSMIEHKVIHLRPTSRLAYDVPNHTDPIITAESPAAFYAMKKTLEKLKSNYSTSSENRHIPADKNEVAHTPTTTFSIFDAIAWYYTLPILFIIVAIISDMIYDWVTDFITWISSLLW